MCQAIWIPYACHNLQPFIRQEVVCTVMLSQHQWNYQLFLFALISFHSWVELLSVEFWGDRKDWVLQILTDLLAHIVVDVWMSKFAIEFLVSSHRLVMMSFLYVRFIETLCDALWMPVPVLLGARQAWDISRLLHSIWTFRKVIFPMFIKE